MKKILLLIAGMIGMMGASQVEPTKPGTKRRFHPAPKNRREGLNYIQKEKNAASIRGRQGVKAFYFDGVEIFARDEKNALRKAKNRGLI